MVVVREVIAIAWSVGDPRSGGLIVERFLLSEVLIDFWETESGVPCVRRWWYRLLNRGRSRKAVAPVTFLVAAVNLIGESLDIAWFIVRDDDEVVIRSVAMGSGDSRVSFGVWVGVDDCGG